MQLLRDLNTGLPAADHEDLAVGERGGVGVLGRIHDQEAGGQVGRDRRPIVTWLTRAGFYDQPRSVLSSPAERLVANVPRSRSYGRIGEGACPWLASKETVFSRTSCTTDTPATSGANGSPAASTTQPSPTAGHPIDYCTLAERIATESEIMVNKHFVPPLKETVDMLKAVVNLSLTSKDQLAASIRPAFLVEMQYFQALKDGNFDGTAAPPAGFEAANKTVDDLWVSVCGFVFDQ